MGGRFGFDPRRCSMRKGVPCAAAVAAALMILLPLAPASAGPYVTVSVQQASGTPSPPANGDSPYASCDISGFLIPGETNYLNSELEPWVAVNPTNSSNIIGVYQQDRYRFGGARGLAAAVTHDGGATWSSTYPHFSICAGGTAANGGDFQRASDPWVTFAPNGDAYFISLSLTFVGPTSTTGTGVLVSKSTDGGDHWSDPVTLVRDVGDADVAPFFFNDKESITADPFNSNYVYAVWDRLRKPGEAESVNAENSFAFRGDTLFSRTTDAGRTCGPVAACRTSRSTSTRRAPATATSMPSGGTASAAGRTRRSTAPSSSRSPPTAGSPGRRCRGSTGRPTTSRPSRRRFTWRATARSESPTTTSATTLPTPGSRQTSGSSTAIPPLTAPTRRIGRKTTWADRSTSRTLRSPEATSWATTRDWTRSARRSRRSSPRRRRPTRTTPAWRRSHHRPLRS